MPLLDDPTLPLPTWKNVKGAVRGLMGMVTPPDPYVEAGRMIQQARQGDYLGALETGFGAMPNTGAIKAYHGSPHNFDRFDLSRIGTGEGAQAYGHGLYFAEHEPVARAYRDKLSQSRNYAPENLDLDMLASFSKGERPEVGREISDLIDGRGYWDDFVATVNRLGSDSLKQAIEKNSPGALNKGYMYEVRINAEPEHFLDWDKPLSEHPQAIQEKLAGKISLNDPVGASLQRAYKNQMFGGDVIGQTSATADEVTAGLNKMGIPGIKYLDQGSRGAGEGSRNYVVFDDKLVDIARKYGLLPLGMGGFDFSQQEQK